ncbi:MAG: hypothetical protein QG551_491, partial [Patescibacteria group bacterium]|nr:hypothetical protein [Patescibacteria group bacterium]
IPPIKNAGTPSTITKHTIVRSDESHGVLFVTLLLKKVYIG